MRGPCYNRPTRQYCAPECGHPLRTPGRSRGPLARLAGRVQSPSAHPGPAALGQGSALLEGQCAPDCASSYWDGGGRGAVPRLINCVARCHPSVSLRDVRLPVVTAESSAAEGRLSIPAVHLPMATRRLCALVASCSAADSGRWSPPQGPARRSPTISRLSQELSPLEILSRDPAFRT